MHTEEQALKKWCPEYRIKGENWGSVCVASSCAHWRWVPLSTKEPGWAGAMKTLISEGMTNAKASQAILTPDVKKRFNLPLVPYLGFCGLSGKPL